jgi:hypothetical protein
LGTDNDQLRPLQPGAPIGFDDVNTGVQVTQQYAHATFSSEPGCACLVSDAAGIAASKPNYLFTYYSCPSGVNAPAYVDFDKPVHNLAFKAVGVNSTGKVASLHVVTPSGTRDLPLVGQGDPTVPVTVDLSDHQRVQRLEIVDVNDPYGMGFDDFTFEVEEDTFARQP